MANQPGTSRGGHKRDDETAAGAWRAGSRTGATPGCRNRVCRRGFLALTFSPGQGSQRPQMGHPLARKDPAWEVVDLVADATGRDLESLLIDADAATLKATRNA